MAVRITCPSCRESYAVDDSLLGKKIRCRGCREVLTVKAARCRDEDDEDEDDRRPERRVAADRRPRDEDDPPRGRPARRRENDEDDRPRRQKAKPGGVSPLLLVGGGVGVVLLVGAVIGGVYLLGSGGSKPDQANTNPGGGAATGKKDDPAPPASLSADDLRRVKQATVYLKVDLPAGAVAEGTGFFAAEPGVVVTNAHVLGMLSPDALPPREVAVVAHSGEANELALRARVLGVDRANDLAVLRVGAAPGQLPAPLRLGSPRALTETQKVYIFGFPLGAQLGKNITVSESSVSSLRRDGGALVQVQVNGGMHPGNSGGPVTDSRGDVVGVSVAVIRGTQINFAIPAEIVQQTLDGAPGDMDLGAPYTAGGKTFLPVRLTTVDPLGRAKEVKLEVWAGERGATRPAASGPPKAREGDGLRQSVAASGRAGAYTAEAPLPALTAGQVVWAQSVVVTAAGATRRGVAHAVEFVKDLALDRKEARLEFKAPADAIERTLHMTSTASMTLFRGKESFAASQKMDGYVLEQLIPDTRGLGTGVRLTLARPKFTREAGGRKLEAPPEISTYLSRYSPTFLVNASNEAKERGNRSFAAVPEEYRDAVEALFESVCNNWEVTTLPLPNRVVRPRDSWPARVPMLVQVEGKPQVQILHLTCTYEGLRQAGGRREGFVRLAGVVKSREARGDAVLGKVAGHALVDVDKGFVRTVRVTISTEVDTGSSEVRMLLTDETTIEREDGNARGIKAAVPLPRKGR